MCKAPVFFVAEGGVESPTFAAATGVRQGCPLSPFLFFVVLTLLFEDLDEVIDDQGITNNIVSHTRPFYDLKYADDVVIFHTHLSSMQPIVRSLEAVAPRYTCR